ncbi:MAG: hypothetical protein ABIJ28_04165 [Patescibacteria group bacterium]|nr:hypothetical protein [Patescibacteria group bacterium]
MKDYTEQQIIEMYEKLPEDLKDAIFSVESTKTLESLGKKYGLNIEQIGKLGNETGMLMIGITSPNEYVGNLAGRLNLDKQKARQIADEVNQQVFSKVRESLKKIHGEESSPPTPLLEGEGRRGEVIREDILKEIEKEEEKIPEIMQGLYKPPPESSFDMKTKKDVFRMSPEESEHSPENNISPKAKYPQGDPYREPVK